MPIHHEFKKGQKVLCILHDGTRIIDKAMGDKGSKKLQLENHSIPYKKIRAVTIYRSKG